MPEGYGNAVTHCLWMCKLTRLVSADCALWVGALHEPQAVWTDLDDWLHRRHREGEDRPQLHVGPWVEGWWDDTLHDLDNNLVGISLGRELGATGIGSAWMAALRPPSLVGWSEIRTLAP